MSEEIPFSEIKKRVDNFWNYILEKYEILTDKMTGYEDANDRYSFVCYFVYGNNNDKRTLGVSLQFMKSTLKREYENVIDGQFRECELRIEEVIQEIMDEIMESVK